MQHGISIGRDNKKNRTKKEKDKKQANLTKSKDTIEGINQNNVFKQDTESFHE